MQGCDFFDCLGLLEVLLPFRGEGGAGSHQQQGNGREEDGVERHPEVLTEALPEERGLLLGGVQVVEERAQHELDEQRQVEERETEGARGEGRGPRDHGVGLVHSGQLLARQLQERAAAALLLHNNLRYPQLDFANFGC